MFKLIKHIKNRKGQSVFKRWHLFNFFGTQICLHKIYQEDKEPYLHDHPWDATMITIWGGYTEALPDSKTKQVSPFTIRKFKAEHLHKITRLLETTYTIAFLGPRRREWGFDVDGVWMSQKDYFKVKWNGEKK